jgi:hypothetical protein
MSGLTFRCLMDMRGHPVDKQFIIFCPNSGWVRFIETTFSLVGMAGVGLQQLPGLQHWARINEMPFKPAVLGAVSDGQGEQF